MSNTLLVQLDQFIRKYYKSQMLKGIILSVGLLVFSYLFVVVLEYFGNFNSGVRTVLFYGFLGSNIFLFVNYIAVPLLKIFRIGKVLSYDAAAKIVGNHFGEIKDKLLNTLQLQAQSDSKTEPDALLEASINQKTEDLKPFRFTKVVDLRENNRYLKYALLPLLILLCIFLGSPSILTDTTERLVRYNEAFEPKAPFDIRLQNERMQVVQGSDLDLKVQVLGSELPSEIYINFNNNRYKLDKIDKTHFAYSFKNLQQNTRFNFWADAFSFEEKTIKVVPKPLISNFRTTLVYPKYLNRKTEILANVGDLIVPEGTQVQWLFEAQHVESIRLVMGNKSYLATPTGENRFGFGAKILATTNYFIQSSNRFVPKSDSISYSITAVADQYPRIVATQQVDSTDSQVVYFSGDIADDYGFSRLMFKYQKRSKSTDNKAEKALKSEDYKSIGIDLRANTLNQTFFYYFNFKDLNLEAGNEIAYFFEISDNDGINGAKSARSTTFEYRLASEQELDKKTQENNDQIEQSLKAMIAQTQQTQQEVEKMQQKLLEQKELTFEDKKKLEKMLKQQQKMQQDLKEVQQMQQENMKNNTSPSPEDQQLMEKQQQIQQIFNQLENKEMKELIKKIEELMKQQLDKQKLDDVKIDNKEVEKELDRMLNFFKEAQLDQKMQKTIDKLDQLAKQQDLLGKQNEEAQTKMKDEQAQQEHQDANKKFDEVAKELDEIKKDNQELETPKKLDETEKEAKDIKKEQDEAKDKLDKNNKKDAAKNQKDAAEKMNQLSKDMKKQMQEQQEEQLEENMQALRMLLENLIKLSFKQEKVIDQLKENSNYSPVYIEIAQEQQRIKEYSKLVEDSLFAQIGRAHV